MQLIYGLVLNEGEARMLTGEHNLLRAGAALQKMGPEVIIIKKGEHGAFLFTPEGRFGLPAYPVEHVVDPTGAGDSFAGGNSRADLCCNRQDATSFKPLGHVG